MHNASRADISRCCPNHHQGKLWIEENEGAGLSQESHGKAENSESARSSNDLSLASGTTWHSLGLPDTCRILWKLRVNQNIAYRNLTKVHRRGPLVTASQLKFNNRLRQIIRLWCEFCANLVVCIRCLPRLPLVPFYACRSLEPLQPWWKCSAFVVRDGSQMKSGLNLLELAQEVF